MKPKVVIVGCGIVGAMIAYELSASTQIEIHVLDKHLPAQGSTGAALGVLMGAISGKIKGRTWRLRETSIQRYRSLVLELAEQGFSVPFNDQGIVSLCYDAAKLPRWQTLKEKRARQGWPLEIWSPAQLKSHCPHVSLSHRIDSSKRDVVAAIYSPADAQVHPIELTRALVSLAARRGVAFYHNQEVTQLEIDTRQCSAVTTTTERFTADWVVISAGLDSAILTSGGAEPLDLIPVLGQAMEIQLPTAVGKPDFQPVINGDDVQFVPLDNGKDGRYWIGATVEFPPETGPLVAEAERLKTLQQGAAGFCGAIAQASIIRTWSGLRPRPVGQPAPVIKPLGDAKNVTLAAGHYRNGVLLAPATALRVRELIQNAGLL